MNTNNMFWWVCSFFVIYFEYSSGHITSPEIERIEGTYAQTLISETPLDDFVCKLPRDKKTTLCDQLFKLRQFKELGIYINKVAFYIYTPTCEKKLVKFKTPAFNDIHGTVPQDMFPCYGRHEPVGTNFLRDTFYDKIYVSSGPDENGVLVYIHEYDAESDWFNICDYVHIDLSALSEAFIEVTEIAEELDSNKYMLITSNQKDIENVYNREIDYLMWDPICDSEKNIKIAICKLIFDQHVYKEFFWLRLNYSAMHVFDIRCKEKNLRIGNSKTVIQDMYPCFAYSRITFENENLLINNKIEDFYVSGGSRKNSAFVYYRMVNGDGEEIFYLFDLIENIYIENLQPITITDAALAVESPTTHSYIKGMQFVDGLENRLQNVKLIKRKIDVLETIMEQKTLEKEQRKLTKKEDQKIGKMYNEVQGVVLQMEEEFEKKKVRIQKRLEHENPLLPEEKMKGKADVLTAQINNTVLELKGKEEETKIPLVVDLMKQLDAEMSSDAAEEEPESSDANKEAEKEAEKRAAAKGKGKQKSKKKGVRK